MLLSFFYHQQSFHSSNAKTVLPLRTGARRIPCRDVQRVAVPHGVSNQGSDSGKSGSRLASLGMRAASLSAKSFGDEEHGAGAGERTNEEAGGAGREGARADPRAHDRVVHVPNETARWVFTNQPEPENTITMQVTW